MPVQRLLLAGMVFFVSAACAPKMPERIAEIRNYNATFLCDGTKLIRVSFTPFAAVLESDGVSSDLTQQPTTGGFLYTGGGQSFRADGKEAAWIDGQRAAHQCRERDMPSR